MLTQLLVNGVNTFFFHPRTQGTVNIYSVVGQSEDQRHFLLIPRGLGRVGEPGSAVLKGR